MPVFGNWFGRKVPTEPSPDAKTFKSGPQFLGTMLLVQFSQGDRIIVSDENLTDLTRSISPERRKMVELWVNF
jgi:hypothetical protein